MIADPFLALLAGLAGARPSRATWVFVPTHAIGATLGERLAREGAGWANIRFVTPLDMAIRMAAPFLLERGLDPSEESLGPALVMRLLLDQVEGEGYFRPMASQPTMADALWRTVRELRYAGVAAAALPPAAFSSLAKHRELVTLLEAYEQHLETAKVADMPVVLAEAVRHLDWCPIRPSDVVTELPGQRWAPLVRDFLDALPGERRPPNTPGVNFGPGHPRRKFIPSVRFFRAGGRDAEVAEVLRRIAASGAPLDQVEVACASEDDGRLVWERASRLGWPVTSAVGLPVSATRPGRLLLQFADWAGGTFAASVLRTLLQSGDCAPSAFQDTGDLTPGQAARLLLKAQATWGRATYAPSLERLAGEYTRRAADQERTADDRAWHTRKATQTHVLAAWIGHVLASIPEPDADGEVELGQAAGAALAFLQDNASRASAHDAAAVVALESALADLNGVLGSHRCSLAEACAFIRARVDALVVGRDRPRSGCLHVSRLPTAGYDGRSHVFVIGLLEGGVFPAVVEDPVLLDAERTVLGPRLRTSTARLDDAVESARARLVAIMQSASHLCLSYPCRDTRQFRDTYPSWIMLWVLREARGDHALTYEDLAHSLGDPVSAVPASPDAAVSDAEWWLAHVARRPAGAARVAQAFPAIAAGLEADRARASDELTPFDGLVPEAGAALDPGTRARATSATTLERAAACPFRHFLEQGLGVRPLDEPEADADAWLDPLTRGSELHALFARTLRTLRDDGRRPTVARDLARLLAWGRERLTALREAMPPPSDEVFTRESRGFLDDLASFLEQECEGHFGEEPVGFEVGFGFGTSDADEPLARAEPLVLDLGGGRQLRLHGRIDRINRLKPGTYEVVDYKTGGFFAPSWEGTFAGGTRLQHAVYGLAATELLRHADRKARVAQGRYVFPAVKAHGRQVTIPAPGRGAVLTVLRDLADVLASGAFLSAESADTCRFCDFAEACHPGAVHTTARKLETAEHPGLEAFRRLRSHD